MKKLVIAHLFLNLYLLALVGPVLPVLDYLINYDYIANELCINRNKPVLACNGKCYLEKKVEANNQLLSNRPDKPIPPKIEQISFPVFLITEAAPYFATVLDLITEHSFYYQAGFRSSYSFFLLRPPQVQ